MLATSDLQIRWRRVIIWYWGAIAICFLGAILAYGPLFSTAWITHFGPQGWRIEFLRAVLSGLLALFLLWNLSAADRQPTNMALSSSSLRLLRYERFLFLLVFALVLLFGLYFLPKNFMKTIISEGSDPANLFKDVLKPYFPYLLYMFGLWLGIAFPVLIFYVRRAREDLKWRKGAVSRLNESLPKAKHSKEELTIESFQQILITFQNYMMASNI